MVRLALEKGEITSSDVVSCLVRKPLPAREYRSLLAQASTLLGRLHARGELERRWIRRNRGCYLYTPSESAIDSLLPLLDVLEERKRRKGIQEAVTEFVKRIVLQLRLEDQVTAVLWNPRGQDQAGKESSVEVWVMVTSHGCEKLILQEAERSGRGIVRIQPIFLQARKGDKQAWEQIPQCASILYGWSQVPPK